MGNNYDIILIGLVAVFLILRLRSVLGKRTGNERPPARDPFTVKTSSLFFGTGSLGGMQALSWAVLYPEKVASAMIIASAAYTSAQGIAFDKVGRNDPCPCGSGKKYKKCHGQ